jgi:5'-methylthioadenosine phosphorylase
MKGLIGGTALFGSKLFDGKQKTVKTPYGEATVLETSDFLVINRHDGNNGKTPPHKINHQANIHALKQEGVEKIYSVSSTGSLKKTIKMGEFVVPHDYMHLTNLPTFFDHELKHMVPGINEQARQDWINACKQAGAKVHEKGVYFQTQGPRFETPAEIQFLKDYADVVGMTSACEATLAKELELPYAILCTVDNYAHGISEKAVSYELVLENAKKNHAIEKKIVRKLIK